MRRREVIAAAGVLAASAWAPVAVARRGGNHDARIKALVAAMTLPEKLGQMTQIPGGRQKALNSKLDGAMLDRVRRGEVGSFLHVAGAEGLRDLQRIAVEESRLRIPLLFAMDVIHGYRTILPVPIALAASWDPGVAERAARIAAEEAWAAGLHWTFAPMVDIARDPRWGRVVEGAGEDPYLGSRMAEAQVRGFQGGDLSQGRRVMACAKHFAGYGAAAGGRDYDSADLPDRTLNEVYLPPFHAAMHAGAGSFMTAFNDVDGVPMTANAALVRGQLRGDWGYQGLVVSDWNAILELIHHGVAATPAEAAALALRAGVDMDMASATYAGHLGEAVAQDAALVPLIDQAVTRILAAKARLGLFDDPYGFGDAALEARGHYNNVPIGADLAKRTIVLLRNEGDLLPLAMPRKIALIGALAADASSALGSWRGRGEIEHVWTLSAALEPLLLGYAPGVTPRSDDLSGIPEAVALAERADVVLLVIGEDYDATGEARSAANIALSPSQAALVTAIKATGKPIVAILMNGRPMALEATLTGVPAVLETWFQGGESGGIIADILFGKTAPAGRLPIGMPRVTGQLPMSYAHRPTGRPADPDLTVDSARYHDVAIGPLFAFGHGLAYTRFTYGALTLSAARIGPGGTVRITVPVTNSGTRAGEEVVQLYVRDPVASVERPIRELRGFARVAIEPGETRHVTFTLAPAQLAIWKAGTWRIEPGRIELMVGSSSEDIRATGAFEITGAGEGRIPAASLATPVTVS